MEKKYPLKRFFGLLAIYRKEIWQIYAYAFFIGLVNLSLPLGVQSIINYIQVGSISSSWVILVGIVLLGIAITGVLQLFQFRVVENIQHDIFSRSALEFAYRVPKLNILKLDSIHLPEVVNRFFDTMTVQKGIPKLLMDFSLATFQIIFGLLLLALYSPYFILLGFILCFIVWLIVKLTGKKGLEYSLQESKIKYNIAHWLEEIADNNKSFKFYSEKQFHLHKTDELVLKYLVAREQHFRVLMNQFKQFIGLKIFLAAGLLILGSLLVMNARLNIGQFVAAEILIILIINSIEKIIRVIETIYDVLTGLEKIGEVNDLELDQFAGTYKAVSDTGLKVELIDVSFQFPDAKLPLFSNINCCVQPGQVALIGKETVKGKTTFLKLLSGLYNMQQGELLFNDIPISNYEHKFLHETIGIYYSTNELFDGSIWENLTLGYEIDEQDVYAILNRLNTMNFIARQPKGIYSKIDSGGRRLPKSVIQKLLLARCLVHSPKLLLLDNPLNELNEKERFEIFDWLTNDENEWTIIISSNDKYWKNKADQFIIF